MNVNRVTGIESQCQLDGGRGEVPLFLLIMSNVQKYT
jgi:hypothetical protein